ncbi:MBL fold metallo-hydrolase [Chitinophaga sp. Cy-1792]|uniref:MBL fold metallo-hydrolase n=1 Tax=Chitinophaga sp. Cy-1792 TaxID=2608339 RepID=UPI001962FDBC|nr:MBL fold metallo-hydrolase [Chitinophaga sp. Cy-1792]NIG54770.1 MBL fold metallo-hydrolase [Chitinophaga sp. Cy-1792]
MIKIHHLNCVDILSPRGDSAIGHCLLLETNERLILIDTGIGLLDTQQPELRIGQDYIDMVGYRFNEDWPAFRQIERLGLNPALVTDCVISHLDNDHIGGLADFPDAVVHIGSEEMENFETGNLRYLKTPLAHNPKIITYGTSADKWFGFEARKIDISIDTNIFLIPLFGHTAGHCGVAIAHEGQWIFYVGDAYYLRVELTDLHHPIHFLTKRNADNDDLRAATLEKIRVLASQHPEIMMYGYHDITEFNS